MCPRAETVFHLGVALHICGNPCGMVTVASDPSPLVTAYTTAEQAAQSIPYLYTDFPSHPCMSARGLPTLSGCLPSPSPRCSFSSANSESDAEE